MADTRATALNNYTNAVTAVRDFESVHEDVFSQHRRMGLGVVDARGALDDAFAEVGEGLDNGIFKVTVTPQSLTTYDEDRILGKLQMTRQAAIDAGLFTDQVRPARITVSEMRKG